MEATGSKNDAVESLALEFTASGLGKPDLIAWAPGRVNVIGEHVDYNGGWVLPAAINRWTMLAIRKREDGQVNLRTRFPNAGSVSFHISKLEKNASQCWSNYAKGVMAGLRNRGIDLPGFDALVSSSIPIGAGLSSSAALEAVFGKALLKLVGARMAGLDLAKLCQRAEHDYAGVPCGLMDQAAVILCKKGNLLLLDCENESYEHVPFDGPHWGLLIINSGVTHELADSEYAKRRAACHQAAEMIGVPSLRHIESADLNRALGMLSDDDEMTRCVRHVVTENDRTRSLVTALQTGNCEEAGKLMNGSHTSLSADYRVSCEELDFIARSVQSMEGVAGCRMTGGGFGGSAIALAQVDRFDEIGTRISAAYKKRFGREPGIFSTRPEGGAEVFEL